MIKVFGILTCDSVRKARNFFKDNSIEIEFIDLKKSSVGPDKIEYWLKHMELNELFNSRGTTYRNLKLKDFNLDDEAKKEWLSKENMLLKRPIVEFDNKALVGWNEEKYKDVFIK